MIPATFAPATNPFVLDQLNITDNTNPKARLDNINAHQIIVANGQFNALDVVGKAT